MNRTLLALAAALPAFAVEVVNHHPFPIRQPMTLGAETVMIDVSAGEERTLPAGAPEALLAAAADRDGLRLTYRGRNAGRVTWSLAMQQTAPFTPLPLTFKSARPAPLYTDWEAKTARDGIEVTVRARVYPNGFVDLKTSLRNVSARQIYDAYAAVVARWEREGLATRLLSYDNRIEKLDSKGATRFSAGEGRHWSLQHAWTGSRWGWARAPRS